MAPTIASPSRRLKLEPLTPAAFAPFGNVIDNPKHYPEPRPDLRKTTANQGTAQRWHNISNLHNFYPQAPSKTPAAPSISFAICAPRELRRVKRSTALSKVPNVGPDVGALPGQLEGVVYDVKILERHPYTPQTFIPIGLSADDVSTKYLVIVAPTLPVPFSDGQKKTEHLSAYPTQQDQVVKEEAEGIPSSRARPFPNSYPERQDVEGSSSHVAPKDRPKGTGNPDLDNIRVFLANGSQAVTYGPGTWHAPMAVIGPKPIEFIIVQNMNGVGSEDCQEVELGAGAGGEGLSVSLDSLSPYHEVKSKL